MFGGMLITLAIMISSPALEATDINYDEMQAAFKKEPPLTQKDIEALIKMYMRPDEAEAIMQKEGFSKFQYAYAMAKIREALLHIIEGNNLTEDQIFEVPRPTKQEVELVRKNKKAIPWF